MKISKQKDKHKRNARLFIIGMLILPILNWLVYWLYVNIQSIALAFIDSRTSTFSFINFITVYSKITDPYASNGLGLSVINTLKYFSVMFFINTPLCLIVSFFFYKKIFGYKVFRIIFYLPAIVPTIAYVSSFSEVIGVGGPLEFILRECFGMQLDEAGFLGNPETATNTILIFCVYTGLTSNVLLFTSAMSRIPTEILEAAKLDGIGPVKELTLIIFPLIWPTFSTQLIFMMTGLFNSSGPVLLFTGGGMGTTTISYWIFSQLYGSSGAGATQEAYSVVSCVGLCFSAILVPIILGTRKLVEKIEAVEY